MVLQARLEFFIHLSVVLSMAVYLITMSEGLSTGIPAKHPIRFNIESQKHGSLLKVMPDGVIKAEDRHPGLLQSSSVWFYDCNAQSIIDHPSDGRVNFTLCHDFDKMRRKQRLPILVYDQINEYFQIHPICNNNILMDNNICSSSSCLFMPIQADIIGVDDYEDKQFYVIFKPYNDSQDRRTMMVQEIMGSKIYGRVGLIQQPQNWDVYGEHKHTLFKIHLEN